VVGGLRLTSLEDLTDLTGLYGLREIQGRLWVKFNPGITDADAEALVAAIGVDNISGEIAIEGNGGE
jgi:hypothetical protein